MQGLRKRIRRVRIVNNRQRGWSPPAEQLHSSAGRAALLDGSDCLSKWNIPGQQYRQHRQHVVNVELADQWHGESRVAPARLDVDRKTRRLGGRTDPAPPPGMLHEDPRRA